MKKSTRESIEAAGELAAVFVLTALVTLWAVLTTVQAGP